LPSKNLFVFSVFYVYSFLFLLFVLLLTMPISRSLTISLRKIFQL
jgi:hypothetical protein